MRSRQRTWLTGGIGLSASAALGVLSRDLLGTALGAGLSLFANLVYAGSVIIFAWGFSSGSSIVGRRISGVVAMVVVAMWPVFTPLLTRFGSPTIQAEGNPAIVSYIALTVPALAGAISVIQIGRARVLPRPWRWVPAWVLVGQAGLWALPEIVSVAIGTDNIQPTSGLLYAIGLLSYLLGTLGLGINAVYLAGMQRPGAIEVFRSG